MKYVMESITAIKELILYEVKDYFQKKQLKEKINVGNIYRHYIVLNSLPRILLELLIIVCVYKNNYVRDLLIYLSLFFI